MVVIPVNEIILGVYLGLLAGIFPAFVAFSLGFTFKYFTNVTIPGLGVVAMSAAIAGVSGGLMGLLEPEIAESWIGITAIIVILMLCLWAHSMGDTLGAETPRHFTLQRFRDSRLSTDLIDRVDGFGQIRVRPIGEIADIPGYPPLPHDLHDRIRGRTWTLPADLTLTTLEERVEGRLLEEFDLAEVDVTIDRRGRARIAAAPVAGGLSRRVPSGHRAVSIETVLPTGVARGDYVRLRLPDGAVNGPVLSARTQGAPVPVPEEAKDADVEVEEEPTAVERAPTTTGGDGRITIAVHPDDVERVLAHDFAPMAVRPRGIQSEYEAIAVLKRGGNTFETVEVHEASGLAGQTIGRLRVRDTHGVVVLAIQREGRPIVAPVGSTRIIPGDTLTIVGPATDVGSFLEVAA